MSDEEGGSNTWRYIGIGCAVAALIGACVIGSCFACAGAGIGAGMVAFEAPVETTRTFMTAVRTHDAATAYAQMSTAYTLTHSQADFETALEALPELAASTDQTISQRNIHQTGATMGGVLEGPMGGTFEVTLHQEGEAWKIDDVSTANASLTGGVRGAE